MSFNKRNLKLFIYGSILIHLVGAVALYFYYQPFSPKPPRPQVVEQDVNSKDKEEGELLKETVGEEVKIQKKKYTKRKYKRTPVRQSKKEKPVKSETGANKPSGLLAEKKPKDIFKSADLPNGKALEKPPASFDSLEMEEVEEEESLKLVQEGDTKEKIKEKAAPSKLFKNFSEMKVKQGNPSLDYPIKARRAKMEGVVSIIYFVTEEGLVDKIQLNKSSGHSLLDNFVLRTVARYEFLPHQSFWVKHDVEFILEGEEEELLKLRGLEPKNFKNNSPKKKK